MCVGEAEQTQEGPDVTLAEEEIQTLAVSPHDTLASILANSGAPHADATFVSPASVG